MIRHWLALVLVAFAVILFAAPSRADQSTAHSVSVAVLAFDSDDAEEQADGLTGALRSRIRTSQGWSLIDTTQSLGMLTAALRCPGKPIPADCEQRIADHIKSDRYIFGYVMKGPQSGQVTAEIHLYQKSKPDTVIRESYADNLKDPNDDTLRKIAQRVLERLGGNAVGTILVRFGAENGEVIVDGDKRVPLQSGTARLELAPGGHSVEVSVTGQPLQKRNVLVTAGKETVVDLALAASSNTSTDAKPEKPFPTRKVVGGALGVLGLVGLTVATINLVAYFDDKDKGQDAKDGNGTFTPLPPLKTPGDVCNQGNPAFSDSHPLCQADADARTHSTIAIVTGVGGALLVGAGAFLFFTAPSEEKTTTSGRPKTKIRPAPMFGANTGGLMVSGSF